MEELGITITQLVELYLPAGFSVSETYITRMTKLYQLMLRDQAEVAEGDTYDIEMWPERWKLVIGYMVVYSVYKRILSNSFVQGTGSDGSASTEGGESGAVKKIVTGPTEVEYHNPADGLEMAIKNLDDLLAKLMEDACPIAAQLKIKLPFCKGNSISVPLQVKGIRPCSCGGCNEVLNQINCCGKDNKPASMG